MNVTPIEVGVTAILIGFAVIELFRAGFAKGTLCGIQETLYQLTRSVSCHYEQEGKKIPERVAKAVDDVNRAVWRADTPRKKCGAYRVHMWNVGSAMGRLAHRQGSRRVNALPIHERAKSEWTCR